MCPLQEDDVLIVRQMEAEAEMLMVCPLHKEVLMVCPLQAEILMVWWVETEVLMA
jgi:hypothetical protein